MSEKIVQTAGRNQLGEFAPMFAHLNDDVLFGEVWNEDAIDAHHASPMMGQIASLREKYDLHMKVERFVSDEALPEQDLKFIKR